MKHYFLKHEFLVRTAQGIQTHLRLAVLWWLFAYYSYNVRYAEISHIFLRSNLQTMELVYSKQSLESSQLKSQIDNMVCDLQVEGYCRSNNL